MHRPYITKGSFTTTGGVVVSGCEHTLVDGKAVATQGDKATCAVCKTPGSILCVGPRNDEFIDGKPIALEGDYVLCKCSPPPRLIASQDHAFQTIEGAVEPVHVYAHEDKVVHDDGKYDQFFHLSDEVTGEPLANRHYRMTFKCKVIEGKTDEHGRTQKVEADHAAEVQIEVLPEGYGA